MSNILDIELPLNEFASIKISAEKLAEKLIKHPDRKKIVEMLLEKVEMVSTTVLGIDPGKDIILEVNDADQEQRATALLLIFESKESTESIIGLAKVRGLL